MVITDISIPKTEAQTKCIGSLTTIWHWLLLMSSEAFVTSVCLTAQKNWLYAGVEICRYQQTADREAATTDSRSSAAARKGKYRHASHHYSWPWHGPELLQTHSSHRSYFCMVCYQSGYISGSVPWWLHLDKILGKYFEWRCSVVTLLAYICFRKKRKILNYLCSSLYYSVLKSICFFERIHENFSSNLTMT